MSVSPAKTRSLSGARVLLVGASGGIGRPLASALADRGAHLAVAGRDRSRLSDLGVGERFTFAFDLADEAAAQPLVVAAAEALGGRRRALALLVPELSVVRRAGGSETLEKELG